MASRPELRPIIHVKLVVDDEVNAHVRPPINTSFSHSFELNPSPLFVNYRKPWHKILVKIPFRNFLALTLSLVFDFFRRGQSQSQIGFFDRELYLPSDFVLRFTVVEFENHVKFVTKSFLFHVFFFELSNKNKIVKQT